MAARLKEIRRFTRDGEITVDLSFTDGRRIKRTTTRDVDHANRTERRWRARWIKDLIPSKQESSGMYRRFRDEPDVADY